MLFIPPRGTSTAREKHPLAIPAGGDLLFQIPPIALHTDPGPSLFELSHETRLSDSPATPASTPPTDSPPPGMDGPEMARTSLPKSGLLGWFSRLFRSQP